MQKPRVVQARVAIIPVLEQDKRLDTQRKHVKRHAGVLMDESVNDGQHFSNLVYLVLTVGSRGQQVRGPW